MAEQASYVTQTVSREMTVDGVAVRVTTYNAGPDPVDGGDDRCWTVVDVLTTAAAHGVRVTVDDAEVYC
jgi:hypothetical protein